MLGLLFVALAIVGCAIAIWAFAGRQKGAYYALYTYVSAHNWFRANMAWRCVDTTRAQRFKKCPKRKRIMRDGTL